MARATLAEMPSAVLVAELERRGYKVTPPMPDSVNLETFRAALFATIDRLDRANRQLGLVPIPVVRRALAGRAGAEHFDRLVLELAARREIVLVWHDRPAALSPEERAGCIEDGGRVWYWIRWGM
ncbi:MAG: hypothetical protein AB1609_07870 [Bacillota bacterium]